jgi:hypothetical protein
MKIEQRLIRQICSGSDALLNPHTSILKAVSDERALGGTHTEQLHAERGKEWSRGSFNMRNLLTVVHKLRAISMLHPFL